MATAVGRRKNLWFGTIDHMQWMPTPNRGASTGGEGWQAGGTTLNGGGYQFNSFGSHRNYIFEWPNSSAKEASALMSAYADGTYGRGLIYFIDPLIYDQNVMPAQWADPSMALDDEGFSHVQGLIPVPVTTPDWKTNLFPIRSAQYDLSDIPAGWRGEQDAVFIPLPEGYSLALGAIYSADPNVSVSIRAVNTDGDLSAIVPLPPRSTTDSNLESVSVTSSVVPGYPTSIKGVWVFVNKSGPSGGSQITFSGLIGKLRKGIHPTGTLPLNGPWEKGQGHSGCRFIGKPTEIKYSGVNGGQVGYAASFREVGSWVNR